MGTLATPAAKQKRAINGCGCLVAVVGVVILLGGFRGLGEWILFRAKAERAEAKVVESVLLPSHKPTARASFDVTLEFRTAAGAMTRVKLEGIGKNPGPVTVGEVVDIWYQADRPSRIRRIAGMETWGSSVVFIVLGALILLSAWLESRRIQPTPKRRK